jgi:effector-binding domain-containing protein/uncharacterized protein YndB with AHSA1/START domain
MKILKIIGIVVLLIIIVSFLIPAKVHVERSLQMNANAASVFPLVNDLKQWEKWSPWHGIDPKTTWEFSGETAIGSGAWYTWKSEHKDVGNGKLTILEIKENEYIKTQMDFEGMGSSYAEYFFTPNDSGVLVKWTLDTDMGMNPIARYIGLFMDGMIGKDYEKGLAKMKEVAEAAPAGGDAATIMGFNFEMREMPATVVAGIRETVKFTDLSGEKFGNWFATIGKTLGANKMEPIGSPMTIYYAYETASADMEAAMPVAAKGKDEGTVKFHELPGSKVLVVKYYGDYSKTEPVYYAAFDYIKNNKMENNGYPMEIYVTDPMMEKDTAKWLTEIVFPVK